MTVVQLYFDHFSGNHYQPDKTFTIDTKISKDRMFVLKGKCSRRPLLSEKQIMFILITKADLRNPQRG